jgi:hypothetical protein
VRLNITAIPCVPVETLGRNVAYSRSLGLPKLGEARHPFLAIVGGGPSIKDHLDELRVWDGVIWAINGAYAYLREHGILSRFFTTDPLPGIAAMSEKVDSAVMATCCDPSAFDAAFHAHVEIIDLDDYPCGPTTASTAPIIAATHGFRQVSFFGCEGNFGDDTHAYGTPRDVNLLQVECNGQEFLTSPQMYHQTQYLADVMRVAPGVFIDRSGGFLSACIADPDINTLAASRSVYEKVVAA